MGFGIGNGFQVALRILREGGGLPVLVPIGHHVARAVEGTNPLAIQRIGHHEWIAGGIQLNGRDLTLGIGQLRQLIEDRVVVEARGAIQAGKIFSLPPGEQVALLVIGQLGHGSVTARAKRLGTKQRHVHRLRARRDAGNRGECPDHRQGERADGLPENGADAAHLVRMDIEHLRADIQRDAIAIYETGRHVSAGDATVELKPRALDPQDREVRLTRDG